MRGHEARWMTKLIRRQVIPLAEAKEVDSFFPFLGNPATGSRPDRIPSRFGTVQPIFRATAHADYFAQPRETRI